MENVTFPPEVSTAEEKIAYLNENTPLICVPADLDGTWYRGLSCPMLVWDKEGLCHVVVPDRLGRAYHVSEAGGRRIYITGKNRDRFRRRGYAVWNDLSGAAPSIWEALVRLLSGMGAFETAVLLFWSVLGGGLLLLLSALLRGTFHDAALGLALSAAWARGAELTAMAVGGLLLLYAGRRMAARICRRAALGLLPALGERLWSASGGDDPAERAALLANAREDGEQLVRWGLTLLCGLGAGLFPVMGLMAISQRLVDLAMITAFGLTLAAAAAAVLSAGKGAGSGAKAGYEWLESRTGDKRFGVKRPFPFGQRSAGSGSAPVWPALPLFMAPLLFAASAEGLGPADLVQAAVLYVPAAAFPLALLEGAARAGRGLVSLKALLRRAERRSGHDRGSPRLGSALELKNVTFTYPGRREPVLRDVDLRVFPGEVLGIAGGTGAGKTTLARIMAGLLTPDMGSVYYGGVELRRYERESVLRRIALEHGEDIRLLDRMPEELDGRTTVVFSAREEELIGCQRIFDLSKGRLILREQKGRYTHG